jgi:DNA-binding LacI/PurR family transcriptional regulator
VRRPARRERLDPSSATPLWAQLRDALRARVDAGEWGPGELIPRELDLCAAYDVSRITAARALHELVREGRLIRQRGRGTAVAERSPAGDRPASRTLAFLTPRFEGDWTLDVYSGFEAVAAEAGCFAMLTSTGGEPHLSAERIRALLAAGARGLAVSHLLLDEEARRLAPRIAEQGVPLVFVGTIDPTVRCDRVVADNARAGRLAAEHLAELGHRRIAFLGPSALAMESNSALRGRLGGYRDVARTLRMRGEQDDAAVLLDALPQAVPEGERAERLLAFLERSGATAAVAGTDALAILVMRYLLAAGLRVPEHLALVGVSDTRLAAVAEVPLTTVRIPAAELGASAARLLLRRVEGDASPPVERVVPVELVVRASCGARTGDHTDGPYEAAHAARDAETALEAALER